MASEPGSVSSVACRGQSDCATAHYHFDYRQRRASTAAAAGDDVTGDVVASFAAGSHLAAGS